MKRYFVFSLAIGCFLATTSCTETLDDFDPQAGKKRLVIDGMVTDSLMRHTVRLSRSTSFVNPGSIAVEDGAMVTITDNTGFSDTLTNIGDGYYLTDLWRGVPGRYYTLHVRHNGEEWTATDQIPDYQNFVMDSLNYDFTRKRNGELMIVDYVSDIPKILQYDQRGFNEVYLQQGDTARSVFFFAKQNTAEVNYFLFRFFRNGTEFIWQGNIFVFDDTQVQENLEGIEIAGHFIPGDIAATQMLGLSQEAFAFYSNLEVAINNDGGLFSPPPGNPKTNISNNGLGFFMAAKQDYKEVHVGY